MKLHEILSKIIAKIMDTYKITQNDIAKKINCAESTLSRAKGTTKIVTDSYIENLINNLKKAYNIEYNIEIDSNGEVKINYNDVIDNFKSADIVNQIDIFTNKEYIMLWKNIKNQAVQLSAKIKFLDNNKIKFEQAKEVFEGKVNIKQGYMYCEFESLTEKFYLILYIGNTSSIDRVKFIGGTLSAVSGRRASIYCQYCLLHSIENNELEKIKLYFDYVLSKNTIEIDDNILNILNMDINHIQKIKKTENYQKNNIPPVLINKKYNIFWKSVYDEDSTIDHDYNLEFYSDKIIMVSTEKKDNPESYIGYAKTISNNLFIEFVPNDVKSDEIIYFIGHIGLSSDNIDLFEALILAIEPTPVPFSGRFLLIEENKYASLKNAQKKSLLELAFKKPSQLWANPITYWTKYIKKINDDDFTDLDNNLIQKLYNTCWSVYTNNTGLDSIMINKLYIQTKNKLYFSRRGNSYHSGLIRLNNSMIFIELCNEQNQATLMLEIPPNIEDCENLNNLSLYGAFLSANNQIITAGKIALVQEQNIPLEKFEKISSEKNISKTEQEQIRLSHPQLIDFFEANLNFIINFFK